MMTQNKEYLLYKDAILWRLRAWTDEAYARADEAYARLEGGRHLGVHARISGGSFPVGICDLPGALALLADKGIKQEEIDVEVTGDRPC